ncbi:MAG: Mysoin-binding motif of peroxisomes-domain-containing protein [Benjaminiella poitrasii]|nr:MAG: Mysoin-binding motif of peroxisomes-domain-containing protein [Benjaminiella poitrasii]
MSEFVVYEDSPLAEYLQSIDQAEATIKIDKPSLSINRPNLNKRPSMLRLWRHSMLHDSFSISLPRTEESAFEEKFKYLIVTSPLLSETLSVHHHHNSKQLQARELTELPFQTSQTTVVSTATQLVASLAVLFGIERYFLRPHKVPILTCLFSTSTSLFFLYRHRRRTSIRELYLVTLDRLQSFVEHSDQFDTKMHRALIAIQEIELVSRGYRLSKPLSPVSRIEQQQTDPSKKKCIRLRQRLTSILRRAFIVHEEAIIDLMGVVHKKNVATLYDMYNVHSIASLSAVSDDNSLEQLKKLAQIMHLKRRECMVHFLALEVMTEEHDSVRFDYQQGWQTVNDVLSKLVGETEQLTRDIIEALDAEFSKPTVLLPNVRHEIQDDRLKKFVHKLSCLEQQLRTMEAKVYLCNENVRQLNSESSLGNKTKDKLYHEYISIQKEFEYVTSEWESGRIILDSFLSPAVTATTVSVTETDIENQKELLEESEGKGMLLHAEDVADILNLPLASKASVYEAVAGVVEKNGKERTKKSRQERIEEMRLKRAKETEEKLTRLDSQNMVHELKNVLYRRVTDLDLNTEAKEEEKVKT